MATIFKEHDRAFVEPRSDAELKQQRIEAVELRCTDLKKVVDMLRKARNADVCFVVDSTGSMGSYIAQVKDSIDSIVKSLTLPQCGLRKPGASIIISSIRLACVAYRDHCDGAKRFQVLDFTNDVSHFRDFLSNLSPDGGADEAEDVIGALDKTRSLKWSKESGVKQIFHMGDAPPHGTTFHDGKSGDSYPTGHPSDPDYRKLFNWLTKEMGIFYVFGKINDSTNRMIDVFSTAAGKPLDTFDVKDPGRIKAAVVDSLTASVNIVVARSKAVRMKERERREYTIDRSLSDWSALPILQGRLQSYLMPQRLDDVINDKPLAKSEPKNTFVKIAPNPFAEGEERIAYYGIDVTGSEEIDVVFKEFKHTGVGISDGNKHELMNQMQTISAFMAIKFTKALKSSGVTRPIELKFVSVKTFVTQSKKDNYRFMTCELKFNEKFVRFSNNAGYNIVGESARLFGIDAEHVETVLAFSHWTHKVTNGHLMIVDLEGVVTSDKNTILLTDPAIHCVDLTSYGNLNHGPDGMKSFFETHECNSVCSALRLKKADVVNAL